MTLISKKVCLLGDFAVGKTSLVRRFVYDRFDDRYISTIGLKVSRKTITVPRENAPIEVKVMLWDLAGSEEFDRLRASYLRGAAGAVLVCDLSRPETCENLWVYVRQLQQATPNAHLVIAGNKVDLINPADPIATHVNDIAADLQATAYLTSAKQGHKVEALFRQLAGALIR